MAAIERGGIPIRSKEDVHALPYVSEQQFALFLLEQKKHLEVMYEGQEYVCCDEEGEEIRTTPDFEVVDTLTGLEFCIEITKASKYDPVDSKARQKKVMKNQKKKCAFFYEENLEEFQRRYPQYDFKGTSAKKIRKRNGSNGTGET